MASKCAQRPIRPLHLADVTVKLTMPSKANLIRQLIAQATPEHFPKSWRMRVAEHPVPPIRQKTRNNREITR